MPIEELMRHSVNFGVAGLMGVLWTWERMMSRQRERQLTEAHERLVHSHSDLGVLTRLIERNTRAVIRFDETQSGLRRLLEQLITQPFHRAAPSPPSPGGDIVNPPSQPHDPRHESPLH